MKKRIFTVLGIAGLLLGSCTRDVPVPDNQPGASGDVLKLKVSVQGMGAGQTRATVDPTADEEEVNSLYLLFFTPSSDRSGAYVGYYPVPGTPIVMNTDIDLSDLGSYGLSSSTAYKVLAVANLDQHAPYLGGTSMAEWLTSLTGKTEGNVYNQTRAFLSASQSVASSALLMAGEADKSADPLGTIQLTLTRSLVRFDVVNSANAAYNLVSVSIWNAFPATSVFGGGVIDYSNTTRIRRFYGIDNTSHADIYGGLYSFPNQVANPAAKDEKTTCLIVGLAAVGTPGTVTYHRVNISAEDGMQDLKRNNAYRLTVRSVNGDGASTEEEAFTGGINKLSYQINFWNLDDDGLIKQNGDIILAIPTKRIRFGAEADERTYDIFAFGGPAGEQIAISTNFEGDAGNYISVTKNGNTITVNAQALSNSGDEREGSITVTYAGLSATIAIYQSGTANQFLRVTTPGGVSIPSFAPYSGSVMDGQIQVDASGPWTAKVYCLGSVPYFGIVGSSDPSTYHSSALTGNFRMQTIASNDLNAPRQAFVLISLDADDSNYNSAQVLTQRAQGGIAFSPSLSQLVWDGSGNLTTPGGISATEFKFQVLPTFDGSAYLPWTASLPTGSGVFQIVAQNHSTTVLGDNYVIVSAVDVTSGTIGTGTLRAQLDGNGPYVDVALRQENFSLSISPNTFSAISVKGDKTDAVSVVSDGTSLQWSAEITTVAANGALSNHAATLVDATSGTDLLTGDANKYALSQKFKVSFPKVYYGNHLKGNITATVTVKLWSGSSAVRSTSFTVTQNELKPSNVNIANYHGASVNYGNLYSSGSHYCESWRTFLQTMATTNGGQAPVYPTAPSPALARLYTPNAISLPTDKATATPVASNVTYVHASRMNDLSTAIQDAIETWRTSDQGVLFCGNQDTYSASATLFAPLRSIGLMAVGNAYDATARTVRSGSDRKVRDFIYNTGPFGPVGSDNSMSSFYTDAYSLALKITTASPTAVAILGNDDRASIVIDPANRVIFIGDDQLFSRDATGISTADNISTDLSTAKSRLLANLIAYTILTAQYGSHFSDLLVD